MSNNRIAEKVEEFGSSMNFTCNIGKMKISSKWFSSIRIEVKI
jgi:hypothetical protein